RFFRFVHSEGELTESLVSKNLDKRRIYIDLNELIVYSANTQYGGNTIGLKKLAMRLAIKLASDEGWLCEHMFLMGVNGPNSRKTYFTGAFPSACGKTSTSMVTGENIVGDDIVYIKERNGKAYSVNVERGMFGIIDGVNQKDDPVIWDVLHSRKEIIFSNILVGPDNMPYWTDSGVAIPESGKNFSGEWTKGKLDSKGKAIPASHKNARFTLRLDYLKNLDSNLDNPEGVEVGGMIYGGRDADTTVPVEEAFDWTHGIVTKGAGIESETTAAALGKQGVRKFNPMSNIEFLSVSIGKYIKMNIDFSKKLKKVPKIYSVNYFMKDETGNFLSDKVDKGVWLKWMELRVHNEIEAIKTPTGYIPKYEDLKFLFKKVLNKDYTKELYEKQFSFRCSKWIEKLDRLEKQYKDTIPDTPKELYGEYEKQRKRINELQSKKGDIVSPFNL
ncbi:MAG TPA: phosphoenolpyruvate carboxykinase domain-containing protein, partial [bacterium]|nr:phosphoenolpyruvate carboxykinase domain-containing protein [bacterium]